MIRHKFLKPGFAATILVLSTFVFGDAAAKAETKTQKKFKIVTLNISGRIMVDYTNAYAKNTDFDLQNLELRRAYLGLDGKVGKTFSYAVVGKVDGSGDVGLVGFTFDWKPKGTNFQVRLGQFKTPMSLDESTSSKYTSVFERAAFTDAIEINRRIGVGVFHTGKKHTFSAGVFGGNIEDRPLHSGTAFASRVTFTPIKNKTEILHLGVSIRYRTDDKTNGELRYRQRPFTHVSNRIISTGRVAKSDTVLGLEAAAIHKNFWAAGEYSTIQTNCPNCVSDPDFKGYYLETGMFFGGRKKYSNGSFARPIVKKPATKGGLGALAIVARYDSIDLNDKEVKGGTLSTLILGADWYPADHIRMGINYFRSSAGLGNSGSGLGSKFNKLRKSGVADEKVKGAILRVQYDF